MLLNKETKPNVLKEKRLIHHLLRNHNGEPKKKKWMPKIALQLTVVEFIGKMQNLKSVQHILMHIQEISLVQRNIALEDNICR